MSLNDKYDELLSHFYKPLIFYIPRNFYNLFDGEKWNDKKFDAVFNTVLIIKPDGSDRILNNKPSNIHIIKKQARLDENIFRLINIHSDLDVNQFRFFIDKYVIQLEFYKKVSDWMLKNVESDVMDLSQETLISFRLQKDAFTKHWQDVHGNFLDGIQKKNVNENTALTKSDLKSIETLLNNSITNKTPEIILTKKTTPLKKPKKKLVSESEVEKFILRTVFNVRL